MELGAQARVAVIGGGPAGAMSAYFLLEMAKRAGRTVQVDIFEPREFTGPTPKGCNMCGGIISETLVQMLATEGIHLPASVILETIEAYALHTDEGSVLIQAPLPEHRIAAIFRGSGPRGAGSEAYGQVSFDHFLLDLACRHGAVVRRERVEGVTWEEGRPRVAWKGGALGVDLLVGAVGVNGGGARLFEGFLPGYRPPETVKAFVSEPFYGYGEARRTLGRTMHILLLDVPGLEFAALVPKGEYATLILLGPAVDGELVRRVLAHPALRALLPADYEPKGNCQCLPRINVGRAPVVFDDRVVMVGDAAVSRLYKDGIGAAYRTAKACAATAIYHGVSAGQWRRHFLPAVENLDRDNRLGRQVFAMVGLFRRARFLRRGLLQVVAQEQRERHTEPVLSRVLWDTFTGSAPYREIFFRTLAPGTLWRLAQTFLRAVSHVERELMGYWSGSPWGVISARGRKALGREYGDGETILAEGERGTWMFVILEGRVEISVRHPSGRSVRVAILGRDNIFGTQSLFDDAPRSYTARALGEVRVLTVDHKGLMARIQEDPTLALRIIAKLSDRIRFLHQEVAGVLLAEPEERPGDRRGLDPGHDEEAMPGEWQPDRVG